MRVITVSRTFPGYHPKAGQPTDFVAKILFGAKVHTIRAGSRWKVGDMASLRYWSGRPYHTKQVEFAQVEIKKVWPIKIAGKYIFIQLDSVWFAVNIKELAANDGLSVEDLRDWFKMPVKEPFIGQIICWSDKVNY